MIEATGLTKKYGDKTAVHNLNFFVPSGQVTGFLGPNGSGKSTTMRMILGLDKPTSGSVTIFGQQYRDYSAPLTAVGALLDAKGVHPSISARNHLRQIAATHGIPDKRVDEVLSIVGLSSVAKKRAGGFSLGMGQRLGIAAAILGDPKVLILDEPVNGLDPEGVAWVRSFVRHFASQGRTVLLSSHLMSEMSQTADRLLVIGRGELLAQITVDEFLQLATGHYALVRTPDAAKLASVLHTIQLQSGEQPRLEPLNDTEFRVFGLDAAGVGTIAAANNVILHSLMDVKPDLESAYLQFTHNQTEYSAQMNYGGGR